MMPSDQHGGLYEQTGLFEGAVTSWGARHTIGLIPINIQSQIRAFWWRICEDLHPMERHYGPEGAVPRPRSHDSYSVVTVDGLPIGLAWVQAPSSTTRAYGFGLFPECRKLGHGICVKQALIDRCFEEASDIHKVEAEVIGANLWSLKVLHGVDDIMTEEGRVRETVYIDGQYYDRIFFGITRSAWQALRE
jgi:hypothetical protein